jgi:hypothetical protein
VTGGGSFSNPSSNPLSLQVYVYGLNNDRSTVQVSGGSNIAMVLYAPQSVITLSGQGTLVGGMVGYNVTVSGGGVAQDSRIGSLQATTTGIFYRTAWAQCTPAPSVSTDPGSGCG